MTMKQPFWRSVASSVAVLVGLIALDLVGAARADHDTNPGWVRRGLATVQSRELNREGKDAQTAGYYEGLLNEGSKVSSVNSLLLGGATARAAPKGAFRGVARRKRLADRYDHRGDFLYYVARPNLDVLDYEDPRLRLVTNSHGLSDKEYSRTKPANTRRIALFGDSISRGMGAPVGTNYESLLEAFLNENATGGTRFEVLNFSVSGYRVTQMFEVAMETAPAFAPDLYVFALTEMIGASRWGEHIAQLAVEGIDLKYDFLRQAVASAGIRETDAPGTVVAKLAPHRLPVLRQVLGTVRERAAGHGASVLVLLVPNVRPGLAMEEDFAGVRPLLDELGVPYMDLASTFDGLADAENYRVSADNVHPNERGHHRLFEQIRDRLQRDAGLARLVIGRGSAAPR